MCGLQHAVGTLKGGPRAILYRESCQTGNRAALSGVKGVPRVNSLRVRTVKRACICVSIPGVWSDCVSLFILTGGVCLHLALYRKWRPSAFDDVYGQEHVTSVLKSEVENGKLSHAYLFCGPRGTGKTTCAKIIAKAAKLRAFP